MLLEKVQITDLWLMDNIRRVILLDLRVAFNESHHVLLLIDFLVELFSNQMWSNLVYLIGRYFNNRHVHYGVTQGSCPGPLLFFYFCKCLWCWSNVVC